MRVTAAEANNLFSRSCARFDSAPAFADKAGQSDSAILSSEHDQTMVTQQGQEGRAEREQALEAELVIGWRPRTPISRATASLAPICAPGKTLMAQFSV